MKNVSFFIIVFILLGVSGLIFISYLPSRYGPMTEAKMADFPKEIKQWKGKDIPLSERDFEILETKNLIVREYKNPGADSIYLYIIYSQENRKALHPPEICYTGGGASTILKKTVVQITDNLKANMFAIESRDSRQLVVYWFKVANFNTPSYLKQQLKFVIDRTLGKRNSGAMIRVSTPIKTAGTELSLNLIKSFVVEIEPLIAKFVP